MQPSPIQVNARAGRAWWTCIHLVYFALASFDLMAIAGGLWLSEYTKREFETSVHSFLLGDLLRNNTSAILSAAIDLNSPANEIFTSGDVIKTQIELDRTSKAFDVAIGQDHYDPITKPVMDAAVEMADGSASARRRGGLAIWYPAVYAKFESLEGQIKRLKREQVAETQATIDSIAAGDRQKAGLHMDRSDEASRQIMRKTNELLKFSAEVSLATVAGSEKSFALAERLQYLIGGGILLLVLAVMAYAHYVGKLLKEKYDELEKANADAIEFSDELQTVNEDVVKLNLDLSASMRKLTEAHDEIVRKGKLAQLGQLIATVAHELRNPLGAVRTSAFLLERKVKGKGMGVEPQLERIGNGITRCDNIISQLLDFARTKSIQTELLDLDDWVAKLVEEEAQRLPETVTIECHLGLGGTKVPLDPARMSRAVVNLLSNASEAMVGKGDGISIMTIKQPRIVVSTQLSARGAELSVTDNGPGISPENIEKILEPLFTTKSFGTGLGLPAVQKILEQHGGGLEVRSNPGQGAAFTAWWPTAGEFKEAV